MLDYEEKTSLSKFFPTLEKIILHPIKMKIEHYKIVLHLNKIMIQYLFSGVLTFISFFTPRCYKNFIL